MPGGQGEQGRRGRRRHPLGDFNAVNAFTQLGAQGWVLSPQGRGLRVPCPGLTCVGHLHVSQRLERALVGHVLELLGAHAVVHALGLLHEFRRQLPDLLGAQVPPQVVHHGAGGRRVQGGSCAGCTEETGRASASHLGRGSERRGAEGEDRHVPCRCARPRAFVQMHRVSSPA